MVLLFLFSGYWACGQAWQDSIRFLPQAATLPADARKIGSIKLGNNGTAVHCDYEKRVAEAKAEAHKMGGNIVQVTELIAPSFISKCYKIKADVYYAPSLTSLASPSKRTSAAVPGQPYALLCVYRLADTIALAASYKLHISGDSTIHYIKSKCRDSVRIYESGPVMLWAETEKRKELTLDVRTGTTYYIRCGLEMGEFRGVPVIELVARPLGEAEFGPGKSARELDISYLQQIH